MESYSGPFFLFFNLNLTCPQLAHQLMELPAFGCRKTCTALTALPVRISSNGPFPFAFDNLPVSVMCMWGLVWPGGNGHERGATSWLRNWGRLSSVSSTVVVMRLSPSPPTSDLCHLHRKESGPSQPGLSSSCYFIKAHFSLDVIKWERWDEIFLSCYLVAILLFYCQLSCLLIPSHLWLDAFKEQFLSSWWPCNSRSPLAVFSALWWLNEH